MGPQNDNNIHRDRHFLVITFLSSGDFEIDVSAENKTEHYQIFYNHNTFAIGRWESKNLNKDKGFNPFHATYIFNLPQNV